MIRNTCLIGGSVFAGASSRTAPVPVLPSAALPSVSDDPFEAGFEGVAATGVGAGCASGALASSGADSEPFGDVAGVEGSAGGAFAGSSSRTRWPASAASSPLGGVATTFPRRMPKPRKPATSRADTQGEGNRSSGQRRPLARRRPFAASGPSGRGARASPCSALSRPSSSGARPPRARRSPRSRPDRPPSSRRTRRRPGWARPWTSPPSRPGRAPRARGPRGSAPTARPSRP